MIRLMILGSGTAIPSPRRGSPGLLLRTDEVTLLVDCGPGSLRAAAAAACVLLLTPLGTVIFAMLLLRY